MAVAESDGTDLNEPAYEQTPQDCEKAFGNSGGASDITKAIKCLQGALAGKIGNRIQVSLPLRTSQK